MQNIKVIMKKIIINKKGGGDKKIFFKHYVHLFKVSILHYLSIKICLEENLI